LQLVFAPDEDELLVALVPDEDGPPVSASTGLDASASRPATLASSAAVASAKILAFMRSFFPSARTSSFQSKARMKGRSSVAISPWSNRSRI
jgi:hypothetical protein